MASTTRTTKPGATTRVRKAADRGRTDWGWLDSRHTFSFGEYHDPGHMGFRALRVINDDRVSPGAGFGTHGHRDMEILSYVLEGALAHKDSMGTGSVIRPGEIQMMRAGTGVTHSEYNSSKTEPVHFLQIWIVPDERGLPPAYGQRPVDREAARRSFALLASGDGRDQSVHIHQDVDLWLALLDEGQPRALPLQAGRQAWVHVARGSAEVNGVNMAEGDGAAVTGAQAVTLAGRGPAEVLVFDLA
jgi:redox-sensitive bicupin YhaK (pirin superfamily)